MKEARRGKLESFESVDALMTDLNAKDWTNQKVQSWFSSTASQTAKCYSLCALVRIVNRGC